MKYRYDGLDKMGGSEAGVVEASSEHEAQETLRRRGVFVRTIMGASESAGGAAGERRRAMGGGRIKTLAHFFKQLSVLVATGTPVVEAIGALERQSVEGKWKVTLADVRRRVEEGAALSEAMNAHPQDFDPVCRSLIGAGEAGGKLGDMLKNLASLVAQQYRIRSNLSGAMVYPALLLSISFVVMCVMLGFVLPRFEGLFKTLDAPLPPTTGWLMALSGFVRGNWYYLVGGAGACGVGGWYWLGSEAGRRTMHSAMVGLPVVGRLSRSYITARVMRVLGVLLEGKVVLLDALKLARASSGNLLYDRLLEQAEEQVTRGETMSACLSGSPLIAGTVVEAIRSGERTGQLGPVLVSVADYLDEENELVVKTLTGIIEPVILIGLGLVIGFMAISMFLPLFDLTSMAKGGG